MNYQKSICQFVSLILSVNGIFATNWVFARKIQSWQHWQKPSQNSLEGTKFLALHQRHFQLNLKFFHEKVAYNTLQLILKAIISFPDWKKVPKARMRIQLLYFGEARFLVFIYFWNLHAMAIMYLMRIMMMGKPIQNKGRQPLPKRSIKQGSNELSIFSKSIYDVIL